MDVVSKIVHELSLWKPQKLGMKSLDAHVGNVNFKQDNEEIKASIPGNYIYDTSFPSLTFDMATGTGKTKLMAACIAYLYHKKISKNFFIYPQAILFIKN